MRKFQIKHLLIGLPIISILATMIIIFSPSLIGLGIGLYLMGTVSGILISSSAYLLVKSYPDPQIRSSRLVSADFFFSFAGVILAPTFSSLFKAGFHWSTAYWIFAGIYLVIILLNTQTSIPNTIEPRHGEAHHHGHVTKFSQWPVSVFLIAGTALLFLFAELVLSAWIPTYSHHFFHIAMDNAGKLVGLYWTAKAIGLLINQVTVRYMPLKVYLVLSTLIGCAGTVILSYTGLVSIFTACVAVIGFVNSGIYASLISYGSLQFRHPTPFVITFIIAVATIGSLCSTGVSGIIYETLGLAAALHSALAAYIAIVILMLLSLKFNRADKLHLPDVVSPWERAHT